MKRSKRKRITRPPKTRTRLRGTIEWNGDPGAILTALIREGGKPVAYEHDIAIRCTYENLKIYEIALDRVEGNFYAGSYSATLGQEKWAGGVNCSVHRSARTLQIAGKWDEGGDIYSWRAQLTPIPSTRRVRSRRKG
jgi:hypothetical protein